MCKCRVVLSFDDGRKDNFSIVEPILKKYGLHATFNIATAYVDRSCPSDKLPGPNEPMEVNHIKYLYNNGHEIAAHGNCHSNILEDIAMGINKLELWINKHSDLGFASPESKLGYSDVLNLQDVYRGLGISYVRIGPKGPDSFIFRVLRKLSYLTGNCRLFYHVYKDSLISDSNYVYHSIPIMRNNSFKQIKYLIRRAILQEKSCILMFHSILNSGSPFYEDTWTWDSGSFDDLCSWLHWMSANKEVCVCTTYEMSRGSSDYDSRKSIT